MTAISLSYALVTPARNEAGNLRRLAACVAAQTVPPARWVVVENGSTDGTRATATALAREHDWIRVVSLREHGDAVRGGAIVRAFVAGTAALDEPTDIVVNLDADISFDADYFERLLGAFERDPRIGIASGTCCELEDGVWTERFQTRACVWGASRAYRRRCLEDVSPLEERHGWDGIDELRANVRGWKTQALLDLRFRHHRREGERDGSRRAAWAAEGRLAHYMGYRAGYLLIRPLYRAVRERRPSALTMIWAYAAAAARREPRWADKEARAYLRTTQRLRSLPIRAREALGRRA